LHQPGLPAWRRHHSGPGRGARVHRPDHARRRRSAERP
jgi:hypothetical protein